jgi:anti-sigma factor RsiW
MKELEMHDEWTDRLSAYLDDELSASERAAVDRHLAQCEACRAVLSQLGRVRDWAEDYEGEPPREGVWRGISEAIRGHSGEQRVVPIAAARDRPQRLRWMIPAALAATLALALVGSGSWWLGRASAPSREILVTTNPTRLITTSSPGTSLLAAEKYGAAIAQLERAMFENGPQLDTATVRILQDKLIVIDRAITEAREALADDPASEYLADHFTNMMQRKLALLRNAASAGVTSS